MPRNPHATNLRHHRQQIIPGKREIARALDDIMEADRAILEALAEREARECPTGNSAR